VHAKGGNLFFIENKGQITDQYYNPRNDIQYKLSAGGGLNIFFGNGAIHYQFSKFDDASAETQSAGNLRNTSLPSGEGRGGASSLPSGEGRGGASSLPSGEGRGGAFYRLDVELLNANKNAQVITEEKQAYYENYYTPGTGAHGATAHTYKRITYKNIYPNIDWVLYISPNTTSSPLGGGREGAKHEFIIHKGGNPSDIKIQYSGATALHLNTNGSLSAATPMGTITELAPYSYELNGKKIESNFRMDGDILSYKLSNYNGELVIDPTLLWATYYGGNGTDVGNSVTTDNAGYVYMAGCSASSANIATSGAFQVTYGGSTISGGAGDAFLVKLDSSGARLWATYYGGSMDDGGFSVATNAGYVYMAGTTRSATGIATAGAYQEVFGGGTFTDAFLVKFDGGGSRQWGTYYGGSQAESLAPNSLAIDALGEVYMAGTTTSADSIATPGSHQPVTGGGSEAFLVKFNSLGVRQWATYYGGTGPGDYGNAVAIDNIGNVYMAGTTSSTVNMATAGAFKPTTAGGRDAFLVKFSSNGMRLWGTYYGGLANDFGVGLGVDKWGNVYIAGNTESSTGLASPGAFQPAYAPHPFTLTYDGFLAKFSGTGARLWGTYYGNTGEDGITSAVTDAQGNVYIGGATNSVGRATPDGYDTSFSGPNSGFADLDGFIAKFSGSGARLYGSYYGGDSMEYVRGMAVDNAGNLYVTGETRSPSAIATTGAFQTTRGGGNDAFLVRFGKMWNVGVSDVAPAADMVLYPNPNTGSFTISANEAGTASIYALDGRLLLTQEVKAGISTIAMQAQAPAGIYLLKYQSETGASAVLRLVVGGE
jgi:hypothetical protein